MDNRFDPDKMIEENTEKNSEKTVEGKSDRKTEKKPDRKTEKCVNLPRAVYYQCVWTVKDLDRLLMLEAVHNYQIKENEAMFCDEDWCTMVTEEAMIEAEKKLKAIRDSIDIVPKDMQQLLMDNIRAGCGFGDYAHENTWKKWKKKFLFTLARNLNLI